MEGSSPDATLDEARAWALLEALGRRASAGHPLTEPTGLYLDEAGTLHALEPGRGSLTVFPGRAPSFETNLRAERTTLELLDLYLPLCVGRASAALVLGHLGQSLDGQIATATGASRYVTGPENIRHLHRLRALSDAVIVGATTVECDDPQMTTRLVPGRNPTRVVLDPSLRVARDRQVLCDGAAPTLVLCAQGAKPAQPFVHAEAIEIAGNSAFLAIDAIIATLRARGLRRLFVEGGGVTVSRFLAARAFSRLHVTICSMFIGAGRPGIVLPAIDHLESALRPSSRRFAMGEDVLFDCSFDAGS